MTSIFPLGAVETHIRSYARDVLREGNVLRWPAADGITSLSVQDVDYRTHDGLTVGEVVTLSHSSPLLGEIDQKSVPQLNKWATLSALMVEVGTPSACLTAKVGVFSSDAEAAERVYAPLLAMEAGLIGWHAARLARGRFHGDPVDSPLINTDQQPPFDQTTFEGLKASAQERRWASSVGERAFTVEFPWDDGAVSNLFADGETLRAFALENPHLPEAALARMGGRTSLLQIRAMQHPLYGLGIHSLLEIPLPVEDAAQLAAQLNRWELQQVDTPPLFGSWCVGQRAPAFVTFVPTQLCFPGLLNNLFWWAFQRHHWMRAWLANRSSGH